jgi:hypothetical protein
MTLTAGDLKLAFSLILCMLDFYWTIVEMELHWLVYPFGFTISSLICRAHFGDGRCIAAS